MNKLQFSFLEKWAMFFKGGGAYLYLFFLIMGPCLFQFAGGTKILLELKFAYGELGFARGYLVRVLETDKTAYGEPVFQYDYSFPLGLETLYGTSYSSEFYFQPGDRVQVEYLLEDPQTSRMYEAYYSEYILIAFIGIGMIVIALISVPVRLNHIKVKLRFLQEGTLAKADFDTVRATGVEVEEGNQYNFSYSYSVGDKSFYINRKTANPHGKDTDEYLIYSNEDPRDVVFLSDLPNAVAESVKTMHKKT